MAKIVPATDPHAYGSRSRVQITPQGIAGIHWRTRTGSEHPFVPLTQFADAAEEVCVYHRLPRTRLCT
jgi:hypothetical protein